jgi:L-fucose isomerase-like protein
MNQSDTNLSSPIRPVGLLVVGRKRPGFDQEWNARMVKGAQQAFAEMGLKTAGAEAAVPDDKSVIAAIEKMRAAGCGTMVILQPSLGAGQLAFTVMQHWDKPVVLWVTPERTDSPIVSSCSLVAQHLWASLFRDSHRAFEFVYGDPADQTFRRSLRQAIQITQVPAELRNTKIGLVGAQAPGFIAMTPDPFLIHQVLGAQLATLSLPMFMDRVKGIDEGRVAEDVKIVKQFNWPMNGVTADDLPLSSRIYLAMKDLMVEEELQALAIQCWPEMGNMMGQWPYLGLTRLLNEGVINSMEGDVDGAITCLLGKLLNAGVGFITDWLEHDKSTIHFWHPGVAPLPMMVGPSMSKHFNIAKPMVVDGPLKVDMPVTIARLWRTDGKYYLTAFEGKTIQPRRNLTGNTALVQPANNMDVPKWFDEALHAGLPHHVVMFAGNHGEAFRRLARVLRINWFTS